MSVFNKGLYEKLKKRLSESLFSLNKDIISANKWNCWNDVSVSIPCLGETIETLFRLLTFPV